MPFVKRNAEGQTVGVFSEAVESGLQEVPATDPDLGLFLARARLAQGAFGEWIESDLAMVRVLEDVIDVLIGRNIIRFTDLSESAQRKVLERRSLRQRLVYVESLFPEDDGLAPPSDPTKPSGADYL